MNPNKGLRKSLLGNSWYSMMQRCYNKKNDAYPRYGGSGILVCEFLRVTPLNLSALIGDRISLDQTIDRINGSLGYYCGCCSDCLTNNRPLNVRWATRKEQNRNRRTNLVIEYDGIHHCLKKWSEISGINRNSLSLRWKNGIRGDGLFVATRRRKKKNKDEIQSIQEA